MEPMQNPSVSRPKPLSVSCSAGPSFFDRLCQAGILRSRRIFVTRWAEIAGFPNIGPLGKPLVKIQMAAARWGRQPQETGPTLVLRVGSPMAL